jgi:heat shock protein HtpX
VGRHTGAVRFTEMSAPPTPESANDVDGALARVPPVLLLVVGTALAAASGRVLLGLDVDPSTPWYTSLFLLLMGIALAAIGAAVAVDPRPALLRRALAGSALAWLAILATGLVLEIGDGVLAAELTAVVVAIDLVVAAIGAVSQGGVGDRLPWAAVAVVILLPVVAFTIAALDSRRAAGGTFYSQAAANRRNSILLLVTLVGVVAATAEIIAVTVTFDPIPALWTAAAAALIGLGAAAGASRFGSTIILESAGAKRADETGDRELVDVVRELSLAANIPPPTTYVIEDGSQNAFATGRDPEHASIAVTRGLLDRMDREELQGVIGHELGHVRNLDTRYALYVAVLVGLVAIVTDGFLRVIVEAWRHGAFYWKGEGKNAAAALVAGLCVGIFLLIIAALLRVIAPLFSALVQAASSRQREFLADATSVEFTRNPRALERALTSIAADSDTLEAANRGTQHLWFRNPVKAGSDRRAGLLSTHPSLAARIDRLRRLQGLGPVETEAAATTAEET